MSAFKRCTRCPAQARYREGDRRCPKCGATSFTWSLVVDAGRDVDGRRRQVKRGGFASKKEAERAERELRATVDAKAYVEPSALTVAGYLRDEWLPAMRPRLADKTWREWSRALERYVVPRAGDLALQELTAAHLSRLYADLLEAGSARGGPLSPATVRAVHSRLRQALSDAVRWRLLERNPAELADPPPARQVDAARRRAMRTWTSSELDTFVRATATHRFAVVWTLAAATGLRRSELLGQRWPDVDLEARTP